MRRAFVHLRGCICIFSNSGPSPPGPRLDDFGPRSDGFGPWFWPRLCPPPGMQPLFRMGPDPGPTTRLRPRAAAPIRRGCSRARGSVRLYLLPSLREDFIRQLPSDTTLRQFFRIGGGGPNRNPHKYHAQKSNLFDFAQR